MRPRRYHSDHFTTNGCRKVPHNRSLRVWHDIAQASATSEVIMGDKEKPQAYLEFNEGHVLDLGEPRQGARPFV